MSSTAVDRDLVQRIRSRDELAWQQCIAEYSGRLRAFVLSRLSEASLADDLVQETFLGFLIALPNYDETTPVESFLFAIASHKITDVLRKQGRRPLLARSQFQDDAGIDEPAGPARMASSMARSREQHQQQSAVIAACLRPLILQWFNRGEFTRLKCAELLFAAGLSNKEVALKLNISEQDVANHKQFVLTKLKAAAVDEALPEDLFR